MSLAFDKKQVIKSYKDDIIHLKQENDQLARKLSKTVVERDWLSEKLKSLDLSSRKKFLDNSEALQTQSKPLKPSLTRQLQLTSTSKKGAIIKNELVLAVLAT